MTKGKPSPYLARRAKKFKSVKKDYQHKNLNNPFFHKHKQQHKAVYSKSKRNLIFTALLLLISAIAYLFFFSSVFTVREIKVSGISRISEDILKEYAWKQINESDSWLFKQKNIIFFETDVLAESLNTNFSFDSLRVYKEWPRSIVISAGERSLAFIWRDRSGQSFSDGRGCLVREVAVAETDFSKYPLLEAVNGVNYLNDQDCLDIEDTYLTSLFLLSEKIKIHPDLATGRFMLEGEFNTLKADLSAGPNILFNINDDLDKQLNKLIIIKQEKAPVDFEKLEYIDLRYGDRAYFK